jgi:hypothetical protein
MENFPSSSMLLPFSSDTTTATATATVTFDSSPALLQQQQRKSARRSVRFFPKVSVKRTISRHSMTQQEKDNCWLQDYEFLMIKKRNHMTIKQIHQDNRSQIIIKQMDELGQCLFDNAANDSVHHVHHHHHYSSMNSSSNNDNDNDNDNENENDNDNNDDDESSLCLRGLEWGLELVALRKKSFRFGALEEVFIEQETQYLGDYYDDEAIAYAYNSISNECQFLAELIAFQDRKEIEDYIMYDDEYEDI